MGLFLNYIGGIGELEVCGILTYEVATGQDITNDLYRYDLLVLCEIIDRSPFIMQMQ